jgi:DnaJ family protein C protein 28
VANIEELIRRAIEEGKFDNLRGKGKPINLDEHPMEDPEWRVAYHILHSSGFTLPWIETRQEIEEALVEARKTLSHSWEWRQAALAEHRPSEVVQSAWELAIANFRNQIAELNRSISSYNLEAPSQQFQRAILDPEREIEKITRLQEA